MSAISNLYGFYLKIYSNTETKNIIYLGESEPITKSPPSSIEEFCYSSSSHKHHTLYCGTRILQSRFYSGARVWKLIKIILE